MDGREAFCEAGPPDAQAVIRLPDLDQAKSAVLNSLSSFLQGCPEGIPEGP